MDPYTTEAHHKLRMQLREFAEQVVLPEARKADREQQFSQELTQKMGEQGLFGMTIPKAYGGMELDYLSLVIATEEIARVDGSQAATVAAMNSLGIGPIYYYGTEEQKQHYLPPLTTGQKLWAFGLTERNAGSDSRATTTKADLKDGKWHINGKKMFISNSSSAMAAGITLQAITGSRGERNEYSTILVESDREGYVKKPIYGKMMWRGADTGELEFNDVKVPESNLLGERGKGSRIMLETLDSGRLSVGAMGLGLAQGVLDASVAYAKKRVQFGRAIGRFQGVSFQIADIATKIEAARDLLYKATWLKVNNQPFAREAAMAKLYTSEIAREAADVAVQVHGGYGLIDEHDIERHYRDQRILQIGEGTSEILKLVISRKLGL